jgi:hypothetical protein
MKKNSEKLLKIGGAPLGLPLAALAPNLLKMAGTFGPAIAELLRRKDGFFAFESALRVFPMETSANSIGLLDWNANELWRNDYKGLADDHLFFAEDIFGVQFCVANGQICTFDPETGDLTTIADSIEKWAELILEDYNLLTGYSIAHAWQEKNGVLQNDLRLIPITPFVCGGAFAIDNMRAIGAVKGMKARANLACQLVNLEDGAKIEFQIID